MIGRPRSEKVRLAEVTVLAALTRAAEDGRACPSNFEIAAMIDCGIGHASQMVTNLEKAGLIDVQRGGVSRVVTIAANGKKTAGTITNQHWSQRGVKPFRPPPVVRSAPLAPTRRVLPTVSRDPCPRCGTRGDIGCSHSQSEARI